MRPRVDDAGRHRYVVTVRADGLAAVLDPLVHRRGVTAAALVDVDSGMVLDAWSSAPGGAGAGTDAGEIDRWTTHAELLRVALVMAPAAAAVPGEHSAYEVVVRHGLHHHHVVALVPDPHGGWLGLAVEVCGSRRVLDRVRRRMRKVSVAALTAGPTTARRPRADGGWGLHLAGVRGPVAPPPAVGPGPARGGESLFDPVLPPGTGSRRVPAPGRPVVVVGSGGRPAPPSALPPARS